METPILSFLRFSRKEWTTPRNANFVAENATSFPLWLSKPQVEPINIILALDDCLKLSITDCTFKMQDVIFVLIKFIISEALLSAKLYASVNASFSHIPTL
ncbi:hypothetical protein D3C81_1691680 [compost metagenome]